MKTNDQTAHPLPSSVSGSFPVGSREGSGLAVSRGMGGHHSRRSGKDEWLTPPAILAALGAFDLDPCAPSGRPWETATRHISLPEDGLAARWDGRVFCNPPYGRETGRWLAKCADHGNAIALIFARTETADWVNHVWNKGHSILFIFGRLHFYHADGTRAAANSGAPSALVAYGAENTIALRQSGIPGALIEIR